MGMQSKVYGYISLRDKKYIHDAERVLLEYPSDNTYPFTNIFHIEKNATYFHPMIGIAGSFKQIEKWWPEWMWKFSDFLSRLEALEARVHLNSIMGKHFWVLEPENAYFNSPQMVNGKWQLPAHDDHPVWNQNTFVGQKWGIVEAPENDFAIDPLWNTGNLVEDPITKKTYIRKWDKFVERWYPQDE